MNMETVGWIAIGWFAVALLVSIALGGFLGQVNASPNEDDLAAATAKRKVMRFMRGSTVRPSATRPLSGHSQTAETEKQNIKVTG